MIFSKANLGTLSTSLAIQACGAATGIMTARLLGPVARGELATVILWPVILSNLGLMGCNWVLAREVAAAPDREQDWIAAGLAVGLVAALIYLVAGYFLLFLLLPADRVALVPVARLCLLLIPLDICNQLLLSAEHGRMRWRRYNVLRLSFFLIYLLLVIAIGFQRQASTRSFVAIFLASHLFALVVRLWIRRKSLRLYRLRFDCCRHLLRAGVPFFGATATNLASLQLDMILVVSLLNARAAGIYVVAAAVANGQSSLGEALGITSFGVLSNELSCGNRNKVITETFRFSALVSCAAGLLLACLVPYVAVPLFGPGFSGAVWPAIVLSLAGSLTASANVLNQALRGLGRPQAGVLGQMIGAGVLAAGAMILLRRFGIIGMAFAVWTSVCAQLLVLIVAAAKWLKISPFEFWPFGVGNIRLFFQQLAGLRLRVSRSLA